MDILDMVKFDSNGLVAAIAQDADTNEVLMLAYMNRASLTETLENGIMVYWSRSRQKRWLKGETSGHTQKVKAVFIDCDGDALLFKIEQAGAACHTGHYSCFYRTRQSDAWVTVGRKISE
jgi:phosphoribosyl-AMP cyclohydrolase